MMRAVSDWEAAAVTVTSIVDVRFTVPAHTVAPGPFSSGMDSPVTMDWSSVVVPSTILPSSGTRSPGAMRTCAPGPTDSTFISTYLPLPCATSAFSGATLIRSRIERRALVMESCSMASLISKRTSTMAASGQAPIRTPPVTATAIRVFMLSVPFMTLWMPFLKVVSPTMKMARTASARVMPLTRNSSSVM